LATQLKAHGSLENAHRGYRITKSAEEIQLKTDQFFVLLNIAIN